ncbi:MAG TPA: DUF3833 family protein [Patescibacteria group bacterium]|nr:DUF3833 family protein [Patescibacteria group bacterium]
MFCHCPDRLMARYAPTQPKLSPRAFFDGHIRAWGLMQDRGGAILQRFDIDMQGTWQGDSCRLVEKFSFYNGSAKERVWDLRALPDGSFEGRAEDVDGTVPGAVSGAVAHWNYLINVPRGGRLVKLRFDDWLVHMNNGVIINRITIRKFGFRVGEMIIFMQKQG